MPTVIEWVQHLEAKIEKQRKYAKPFEARYRNEYVLPFIVKEYQEVYGATVDTLGSSLAPPRTGTAAIGIDALVERLTVTGVSSRRAEDAEAVRRVQEAWEDNDLDVQHREAHREAFIKARSFAQVSRSADGERAVVGIEAPEQMAVHREQIPPYDIAAALKIWTDEWTGQKRGSLQLPGRSLALEYGPDQKPDPEGSGKSSRWEAKTEGGTGLPGVPVVEFACRPRLLVDPVSEIETIATLVDIVDLIEGLMVFAGHFGAVPIRYATGLPVARDPADPNKPLLGPDGRPVIGFKPRADHFWTSTEAGTKFGQLEPAGLASFVSWAEHLSQRVRAKTSIPGSYYGIGVQTHMSAELLKTDEAPMVRRVLSIGRDGSFGTAWRRVLQLILQVEEPGTRARLRPRWADPETRVEAQATDSAQKLIAAGYGLRAVAEKVLGWEPELVERAVAEAAVEQERVALMAEALSAQTGSGGGSTGLVAV